LFLYVVLSGLIKGLPTLIQWLYKKLKLYHFSIFYFCYYFWTYRKCFCLNKIKSLWSISSTIGKFFISRMLIPFAFYLSLGIVYYSLYKKFEVDSKKIINFIIILWLVLLSSLSQFLFNFVLLNNLKLFVYLFVGFNLLFPLGFFNLH